MAGDWNILQGLRILVGGWLRFVNLQEPRRETEFSPNSTPLLSG